LFPWPVVEFAQIPLAPSILNQIIWNLYHWKVKIQIYRMVEPHLGFVYICCEIMLYTVWTQKFIFARWSCCLFVISCDTSLEWNSNQIYTMVWLYQETLGTLRAPRAYWES
jgi:hypothetical protein